MADEKVMEWIQRELDGDLSPEERKRLESAASRSTEYARLLEEMRILSEHLSRLPQVEPPVSVVDQIMPEIEAELRRKQNRIRAGRGMLTRARVAAAAVAVIVLGLGGWLMAQEKKELSRVSVEMDQHSPESPVSPGNSKAEMGARALVAKDPASDTSLPMSEKGIPSPDGRYVARWAKGTLVVRNAAGRERYRSRTFSETSPPEILWQSGRVLQLSWPGGKTVVIDVEAGREKR
jgi:hypothetical protein